MATVNNRGNQGNPQGNPSASVAMVNREQTRGLREIIADKNLSSGEAAWEVFREYARERPEVVAMWTFGIGFVLGWKLKIW
jgi:hypothetical protein